MHNNYLVCQLHACKNGSVVFPLCLFIYLGKEVYSIKNPVSHRRDNILCEISLEYTVQKAREGEESGGNIYYQRFSNNWNFLHFLIKFCSWCGYAAVLPEGKIWGIGSRDKSSIGFLWCFLQVNHLRQEKGKEVTLEQQQRSWMLGTNSKTLTSVLLLLTKTITNYFW